MSDLEQRNVDVSGFEAFLDQFDVEQRPVFIAAFVQELDQRAKVLSQAVTDSDEGLIRREAHGIKGTCATFQLLPLSTRAANVEQIKTNIVGLKKAAVQLESETKSVVTAVSELQLENAF